MEGLPSTWSQLNKRKPFSKKEAEPRRETEIQEARVTGDIFELAKVSERWQFFF